MWDPEALGWTPALTEAFTPFGAEGLAPARVAVEHQHLFGLYTPDGDLLADVSGHMRHHARSRLDFPVAGDWVAVRSRVGEGRATIQALLPRKSLFSRQAAGKETDEQPLAANIDTVFLVMGLDRDYNPRRFERYLALASKSGAVPIALLTKPDLCDQTEERRLEIAGMGVAVHVLSPKLGEGLEALTSYLSRGATVALLGSSGVGKSTLINRLLGEKVQETQAVRAADDKGLHTTTQRELLVAPGGALIIDTPGMRELSPWDAGAEVAAAFTDVAAIAARCKFRDCAHAVEPGCAVQAALADGSLDPGRWQSYLRLRRATAHAERRHDRLAQQQQKTMFKKRNKDFRVRLREESGEG